jgi:glucosylceramidase
MAPVRMLLVALATQAAAGRTVQWVSTTEAKKFHIASVTGTESDPTGVPDACDGCIDTLRATTVQHQTIQGFGCCFNELGYDALQLLSAEDRDLVTKQFFDPDEMHLTYNRVPVGANDYADGWYSHDEMPAGQTDMSLAKFAVTRDEGKIIPYIQSAQKYMQLDNTSKKHLFASAWSPPVWMKQNGHYSCCNSTGGIVNAKPCALIQTADVQQVYAKYLSKFVSAYKDHGIEVTAMMVQNEPYASGCNYPKCDWTGVMLRDFIKLYAGPQFEKDHANSTKMWLGTLNTDDFLECPNTVLSDPLVRKYVGGVAMQWAGKNAVQRVHETWPEIDLIQSENECGDGKNTYDYAIYIFDLIRHYLGNGVIGYTYWNPILSGAKNGSSHWGWNQNSMISVDSNTIVYNPEFYVFKHYSQFVKPGAIRLGVSGDWSGTALVFINPVTATAAATTVAVVMNPHTEARKFEFQARIIVGESGDGATKMVTVTETLEPRSFNTFVI